jgi:hypothetical protein
MHPLSSQPVAIEPLESRALFSSIFGLSFDTGPVGFGPNPNALPPPALQLPQPALALPTPTGAAATTSTRFDVRGHYSGTATTTAGDSTSLLVSINRQRKGKISGTISFPDAGLSFSGTATIVFLGNRRFSFLANDDNGNSLLVTARANRDGTTTGAFTLRTATTTTTGTFTLTKFGPPGSDLGTVR